MAPLFPISTRNKIAYGLKKWWPINFYLMEILTFYYRIPGFEEGDVLGNY